MGSTPSITTDPEPAVASASTFDSLWATETAFETAIGTTRADVTHRIGPPAKTITAVIDSSTGWPDLDSSAVLTFSRYEVGFLITKDHHDILYEVALLTDADTLAGRIRVGMRVDALTASLTAPLTATATGDTTFLQLQDPSGSPSHADIRFVALGGVVRRIVFEWLPD